MTKLTDEADRDSVLEDIYHVVDEAVRQGSLDDRLHSKQEAADYLGVSVRFLETFVATDELRSVRIGRRRLFRRDDLRRFVERKMS